MFGLVGGTMIQSTVRAELELSGDLLGYGFANKLRAPFSEALSAASADSRIALS